MTASALDDGEVVFDEAIRGDVPAHRGAFLDEPGIAGLILHRFAGAFVGQGRAAFPHRGVLGERIPITKLPRVQLNTPQFRLSVGSPKMLATPTLGVPAITVAPSC